MGRHRKTKTWKYVSDDPPEILEIARKRTQFMLFNMAAIDFDLSRLLVSAYMQGVYDTAIVAFKNGFVPPGCDFTDAGEGI